MTRIENWTVSTVFGDHVRVAGIVGWPADSTVLGSGLEIHWTEPTSPPSSTKTACPLCPTRTGTCGSVMPGPGGLVGVDVLVGVGVGGFVGGGLDNGGALAGVCSEQWP